MRTFVQHFVRGLRLLKRHPGPSFGAVLALALGIGAASAIFSVVQAVLLRPLPFPSPERLTVVWESNSPGGLPKMFAAPPNLADWRDRNRVFEEIGAYRKRDFFLETPSDPLLVKGSRTTAGLLSLLKINPAQGRLYTDQDDRPGAEPVAVISHRLWQNAFGSSTSIIGRTIRLSGVARTVIGVMPPGFDFGPSLQLEGRRELSGVDLWVPFALNMADGQRGAHYITAIGRLKKGVSLLRASAEMKGIAASLQEEYPDTNQDWDIRLEPLEAEIVGDVRPDLLLLSAAVGLLLMIACLNVAHLLLARASARRREFAVRSALGAPRRQLALMSIAESQALSFAGGGLGLIGAFWGIQALIALAPEGVPRLDQAGVDGRVLVFTLLVSMVTGTLFGLAPALEGFASDPIRRLREGGRESTEGQAGRRLRSGLIVLETALSLILLISAGLLFRSLLQLQSVDVGFQSTRVVTALLALPQDRYPREAEKISAFRDLERLIGGLPPVQSAGFIYDLPLDGDRQGTSIALEGESFDSDEVRNRSVNFSFVTPGYFEAMGVDLRQGRGFDDQDATESEPVFVINQSLASRYFPQQSPLDRRLSMGFSSSKPPGRIVGVVNDVRHDKPSLQSTPIVYLPYYQVPWSGRLALAVRGKGSPSALPSLLRAEVRRYDRSIPVYRVRSMDKVVSDSISQERFSGLLLAVFSLTAWVLATLGIYGVVSYSVHQRIRETGIRMALGARSSDILSLVISQGMKPVLLGMILGVAASALITRVFAGFLYDVAPIDPLTFGTVVAAMAVIAFLACVSPGLRATRVDPVTALRWE